MARAVLEDWRAAPIDEKLRATLGFLQKLTLSPLEVRGEDVAAVRAKGVRDEAIVDAIYLCALFNIIDRIADALGFYVPTPRGFAKEAKLMLKRGYRV